MPLPFSQFTRHDDLILTAGQGPVDPSTLHYHPSDFETEACLTLENLKGVLEEAGSSMDRVLRVTVYLSSMDDYETFNKVYLQYFRPPLPARSCVAVSGLAFDMKLEIDAIASTREITGG